MKISYPSYTIEKVLRGRLLWQACGGPLLTQITILARANAHFRRRVVHLIVA